MKHAIAAFVGRKDGLFYYDTECGVRFRLREPAEDESIPVNLPGGDGEWCPACHPERCQQQLEGSSLHPDLGAPEEDLDDGATIQEDHGEEEVVSEEVVEGD